MTSASHLAMGHMVPRPAPFTWQCVIRYHDQCLSPGSMSYGTTTVVYGHSSVSICGGSIGSGHCACLTGSDITGSHVTFSRTFPPVLFFPILLSLFFFPYYFPVIVSRTFPPIFLPVLFSRIFFNVLFFTVFFLRPFF